jgi:glycosyltransferase involved in cell wall biosynthesis
MKISVVTISFNQARFLRECIESVLSQGYRDLEYIVVDPGSTDGSREIIDEYRDRIQTVVFEPDKGPADGLNKGFSYATGDIFYYLNADDVLVKGSLSTAARIFAAEGACDIVLGRGNQIDEHSTVVRKLFPSKKWSAYRYAMGVANAIQQGTFFRASAFHATDGFNTDNRTCWDGELLVDMVGAGARVRTIPDVLGSFRIYSDSISGSGRLVEAYNRDQRRIREKILSGKPRDGDDRPVWLMRLGGWIADPERLIQSGRYWGSRAVSSLRMER